MVEETAAALRMEDQAPPRAEAVPLHLAEIPLQIMAAGRILQTGGAAAVGEKVAAAIPGEEGAQVAGAGNSDYIENQFIVYTKIQT